MAETFVIVDKLDDLMKESLNNYQERPSDGMLSGHIDTEECYNDFMSNVSTLGYLFSVYTTNPRDPVAPKDEKLSFNCFGSSCSTIQFFGPLFSIEQTVYMECKSGNTPEKDTPTQEGELIVATDKSPQRKTVRFVDKPSKKKACPTRLSVRCIKMYPDFCASDVANTKEKTIVRKQLVKAIKSGAEVRTVLRYLINATPEKCHNHPRTVVKLLIRKRHVGLENSDDSGTPVVTNKILLVPACAKVTPVVNAPSIDGTAASEVTETNDETPLDQITEDEQSKAIQVTVSNVSGVVKCELVNVSIDDLNDPSHDRPPGQKRLYSVQDVCNVDTVAKEAVSVKCGNLVKKRGRPRKVVESEGETKVKRLQTAMREAGKKMINLSYLCKDIHTLDNVMSSVKETIRYLEESVKTSFRMSLDDESSEEEFEVAPRKKKKWTV